MPDAPLVVSETQDHVTTIELNRPERRNALNFPAYAQLEDALRAASADPGVIRHLMGTEDHKEGVAAFLEKRAPKFAGR